MSQPFHIGVLLAGTVQLLDLAAIDLLYMTTPEYLQECSLPQPLVDMGRPCEIHYIAHQGRDAMVGTTAQMSLRLTDSLADDAVAPGKLDVVVIPGPSPKDMPPAEEYLDFVRKHHAAGTSILSICTGAYVIGYSGIANGREVTAPRLLIPEMKRKFPEAKWDDSVRVARDGNLWTSGGITNGHDLVVGFLREHYPAALVNTILVAADIPSRPVAYSGSATSETVYVPSTTKMPIKLFILVFVASPLDYARYRHTALYLEFSDPQPTQTELPIKSSFAEVVGSTGYYSFSERVNWEIPSSSTDLARTIPVATLSSSTPISHLRETISRTPIPEVPAGEEDWNSQNWVWDTLERLVVAGYIDAETKDRGLEEMVEVVLEAGDEEIPV
ncbi:hypothetical protein N7457_005640 [Penicillium paradoxum]|uniref:uncharacterized protein n=1 Tax=Penicillium paradoxum TaxID=176176 RepID=UPI0025466B0A|nr:uncharacterized protein N7457_005640 [Penicillium paradoxum]KAJ5780480.1 hypothetical protein N7457_005640 [Penicillium paradoxum]